MVIYIYIYTLYLQNTYIHIHIYIYIYICIYKPVKISGFALSVGVPSLGVMWVGPFIRDSGVVWNDMGRATSSLSCVDPNCLPFSAKLIRYV